MSTNSAVDADDASPLEAIRKLIDAAERCRVMMHEEHTDIFTDTDPGLVAALPAAREALDVLAASTDADAYAKFMQNAFDQGYAKALDAAAKVAEESKVPVPMGDVPDSELDEIKGEHMAADRIASAIRGLRKG